MIDNVRGETIKAPVAECWRVIGVSGDRSCRELERFIHCRNCPVLAEAAREFFDRPPPAGYLETWREILEQPEQAVETDATSVLVFRVDHEWLALPAQVLVEVTPVRTIHTIPHRGGTPLAGLVNIRGELRLCVSLHAVLGLGGGLRSPGTVRPDTAADASAVPRLLVIERAGPRATDRWVLGVDDVAGVQRVPRSALRPVPATVSQAAGRCSTALFRWQEGDVAILDEDRLFEALRQAVAT
ncbi:MAG: chemotaxis protein [Planctomycetes bacterium]|nr:chemotaxis protein [Planctomycetota bacterium]